MAIALSFSRQHSGARSFVSSVHQYAACFATAADDDAVAQSINSILFLVCRDAAAAASAFCASSTRGCAFDAALVNTETVVLNKFECGMLRLAKATLSLESRTPHVALTHRTDTSERSGAVFCVIVCVCADAAKNRYERECDCGNAQEHTRARESGWLACANGKRVQHTFFRLRVGGAACTNTE